MFSDPTDPGIPEITLNALDTLKRDDGKLGHFYKVLCTVTEVLDGWCYIGCPAEHCRRKVEPEADQYYCGHCCKTVPYIAARFRIQLKVADNTGASNFVIMEKEASRYFNTNAHPLFEMNKRNYIDPPEILHEIVGKSLTFLIELDNNNMRRLNSEYTIYEIKDKPTNGHDMKESSMDLSSARTSSQSLHNCVIAPGLSPNTNKTAAVPEMTPTSKNSTTLAHEAVNDAAEENNLVNVEVGEVDELDEDCIIAAAKRHLKRKRKLVIPVTTSSDSDEA
ncbi:hypothetical protein LINPERHAP2_LOCUS28116 [Linum perenne]